MGVRKKKNSTKRMMNTACYMLKIVKIKERLLMYAPETVKKLMQDRNE